MSQEKKEVRINKYLSEAGICSRRQADKLVEEGKVYVDGVPAAMGMKVVPGQEIRIGKKIVCRRKKKILLAVNKPVGIVCTEEKRERKNIIRFLNYPERITYAGRLDKDSQGLLLMTNDGDLIQSMMRARNCHEKEYKVTVRPELKEEDLKSMSKGVPILGTVTRPCKIIQEGKYTFRIVLTQGLNRQIRRMCEYFGYEVQKLKRERIMNIKLGDLKEGAYRKVEGKELEVLLTQLGERIESWNEK